MADEHVNIHEIVDRIVDHKWSVPEFQRGFVWKPVQVRDLIESLWLNYPIGSLLLWNSKNKVQERGATDAQGHHLWLVDGQQRTTAFAILFGRKPYWWPAITHWHKTLNRYDIRFDIEATQSPFFWVADASIRNNTQNRYLRLSQLLTIEGDRDSGVKELDQLANQLKDNGLCEGSSRSQVFSRLKKINDIRKTPVIAITIEHELEDVVEIFSRMNSKGTRVTEADIYLGVVAAKNNGWVRDNFIPYRDVLAQSGFDIDPNLLFRTITGVGAKKVRFKEINEDFWEATSIQSTWASTKQSWSNLISRFQEYGILSNSPLPTEAALVVMIALLEKFPKDRFETAFYWFLQASRFRRYSGASVTALDQDLKDVNEAKSLKEAIRSLLKRFDDNNKPLDAEFFMNDYISERFGRLLLYLLAYKNQAVDWDENGHRIGFRGTELLSDFSPQWHHIFPVKFLEQKGIDEKLINALANIAAIGSKINVRISDKSPTEYINKYNITTDKLRQQFITDDITQVNLDNFENWLLRRAEILAKAGNDYLNALKADL